MVTHRAEHISNHHRLFKYQPQSNRFQRFTFYGSQSSIKKINHYRSESLFSFADMETTFFRSEQTRAGLIAGRVRLCGTLLWVGSFLVGFLLFVALILPTLDSKGYISTLCNVTDFTLRENRNRQKCDCVPDKDESKCVIFYPCVQLIASYNLEGKQRRALVVKCPRHAKDKCSYTVREYDCISERSVYNQLKNFRDTFATFGKVFTCHVKPDQPDRVLLMANHLKHKHVINIVLWPALGVVIGLILTVSSKIVSSYYCGYYYQRTRSSDDLEPLTSTMNS